MIRPLRRTVAVLVLVATVTTLPERAAAQAADPWFGTDKALHLAATSALALGGWGLGRALFREPGPRYLLGAGLALGAGVAKEVLDRATGGEGSGRDLAWDLLGTATGLLTAWVIEAIMGRVTAARPADAGSRASER